MEKHITDASVKAGLQIEADTNPLKEQEKKNNAQAATGFEDNTKETDADDLVHEKENDASAVNTEQDPDELVHSSPSSKTVRDNEEVDPDDLVHENNEDPFDE